MAVLPVYLVVMAAGYETIGVKQETTTQCLLVLNQSQEDIGKSWL